MPGKLFWSAISVVVLGAWLASGAAVAQPNPNGATEAAVKALADACYAPYGLKAEEKVQICSKAIESGALKSVGLAMAFYNRASAYAGSGNSNDAMADYKQALRVFTDVIRVSAPNGAFLFQRGAI